MAVWSVSLARRTSDLCPKGFAMALESSPSALEEMRTSLNGSINSASNGEPKTLLLADRFYFLPGQVEAVQLQFLFAAT